MITRYKCVAAASASDLTVAVSDSIDDGWQPFGGPVFDSANGRLTQAMIEGAPDHDVRVTNPSIAGHDAFMAGEQLDD